jgi:hypothetical protein
LSTSASFGSLSSGSPGFVGPLRRRSGQQFSCQLPITLSELYVPEKPHRNDFAFAANNTQNPIASWYYCGEINHVARLVCRDHGYAKRLESFAEFGAHEGA